jgi:hypothetical protein
MDLSFFRRAQATFARSGTAPLDYRVLVASLEAMQSASPAARSIRSGPEAADMSPGHDPIVELLLGGPAWRDAVAAQRGCFNRAQVKFGGRRP